MALGHVDIKFNSMNVQKWQVKAALLMVSSLTIMSMITVSASLPEMAKVFAHYPNGASLVKLSLAVPGLFIALSAMIAGPYIDRFGRLKLLGLAMVLFAAGGTSGFWSNNLYIILGGRALLGLSVGVSMTIVTTLVADYYDGRARRKFAGLQIAIMSISGIVFISLGGVLADISWRTPFLLYLYSLLILPFVYHYLKEPKVSKDSASTATSAKSPSFIWIIFTNVMLMWILFLSFPYRFRFI